MAGGQVKSSVSKKVTHVVCNYPDEGTAKLKRARQLGIPVINEEQLLEMIGNQFEDDEEINPDDEF